MSHSRVFVAGMLACSLALGHPVLGIAQSANSKPAPQKPSPATLRIVVLRGQDAVNIVQPRTAVAPVVEVRDGNNRLVAGAPVTFSIPSGGNATFAGASTVTVTTNAVGQAAVTTLTPTGAGAVRINVVAAFQGQTASAAITQTNFATAAQAAAAGSSGSSAAGGGGIGVGTVATLTAVTAGVVGGVYAYRKYEMGDAPNVGAISLVPTIGMQAITSIRVGAVATWHGDGASYRIDFGDGTVVTAPLPNELDALHVYDNAGTFTVRLTLTDAWDRTSTAQGAVVIKSLTGRWNVGTTGSFFTLTQSGTSVTGTFTAAAPGQGSGVVLGILSSSGVGSVTLIVTPTDGGPGTSFAGTPDVTTADTISGRLNTGADSTLMQLVRQ